MRMIFVNLAVADVGRARGFFEALGFAINPMFSSEHAACVMVEENIALMLLARPFFASFLDGEPAPPGKTEAILCLSAESRAGVDALADRALAAGGASLKPPQDHGFMYGRSFRDPDGHAFEIMWMDTAGLPQG